MQFCETKAEMEEGDTPGPVPTQALEVARILGAKCGPISVEVKTDSVVLSMSRSSESFVAWRKAVKDPSPQSIILNIDCKLLFNLAKALGAKNSRVNLTMEIEERIVSGPIRVQTWGGQQEKAFGLIMPLTGLG